MELRTEGQKKVRLIAQAHFSLNPTSTRVFGTSAFIGSFADRSWCGAGGSFQHQHDRDNDLHPTPLFGVDAIRCQLTI